MRFLDTSRIRTLFDERVPAADGTELSVDLYLPPQPGCYPVLLNRTPYDNNRAGRPGISSAPAERWKAFAAQGYIVAAADVRGRGDSDGQFIPFVHEAADGVATVAWLRKLPESDGRIAVFGSGYSAFCAWATAIEDGNLQAVASISPFGAVGECLLHCGGAVRLDWLFWMHLVGGRTVQPANVPPWHRIHRHLPLNTLDKALGREDIWWREWLDHLDSNDSFWAPLNLMDKIAALNVPSLHITGLWDGQIAAARSYYEAASRSRAPHRLVVGPWDTAAVRRPVAQIGGFDFGPRSVLDLDETLAGFFDACLRPSESRVDSRSKCETSPERIMQADRPDSRGLAESCVFVTGRNEWLKLETWPLWSGRTLNLHLSSTMGANTRRGDGTLSATPLGECGVDVVTHNPLVPVDFQPLFVSFAAGTNPLGFTLEQSHITSRDEALVYTSSVLERPVTVLGRPKITLTVRTRSPDADLYVLLSDNFPLGTRDLHLCHAAVRLATLKSFRSGEPAKVELELGLMAHDFLPGHQIRVTITPSLYPLYARNLHARDYIGHSQPALADIEVLHGSSAPAFLTLPLLCDRDAPL